MNMAPIPNTKRLSLCFLFSALLLFKHGSSARDMKVQELSKDSKPYTTSSGATKEKDPYAGYNFAYPFSKHIHPSQHEGTHGSNQPYLTGYRNSKKDQKEMDKPYITAYGNSRRVNQPYITSYGRRVNQPYITAYGNSKRDSQPYITKYGNTKRENQPYITAYVKAKRMSEPYLIVYGDGKKDSKVSTQDSDYIAGYRTSADNSNQYLTGYRTTQEMDGSKQSEEEDTEHQKMSQNYAATYGKDPKDSYAVTYKKIGNDLEKSKGDPSSKVDHTEAFKTGFFTLDDLYLGNTMILQFPVKDFPHFLPRKEAESIPFSMSQLPSVLQLFSISEDSPEGQAMKNSLEQCGFEPLTGETKVCITSLESMIEFVRTIIGSEANLNILTTSFPTTSTAPLQNFTILEISQDIYSPKWVACHPMPYPYAVFYCHFISTGSRVLTVQLAAENGDKMEALGLCHLDTSEWSPDHILFRQLGMKPGEAPVCHFFPVKHLLWVPLPSKATM